MALKVFISFIKVSFPISTKRDVNLEESAKAHRSLTVRAKATIVVALLLVALITTVLLVCFLLPQPQKTYWFPEFISDSKLGNYSIAAVSTDAAPCAPIGREILERNGSQVDAAIAVMVCMGAVNPHSMGLGGGFLMLVYKRDERKPYFFDAREMAPLAATKDMFSGNATLSQIGGKAIAVPGELAGYDAAHKKFGVLPWGDLFSPTIKLCEEGIPVGFHLAAALNQYREKIMGMETMRNVFVNNETGDVYQENELIKRHDLAETLKTIAKDGRSVLYGPHAIASKFLEELKSFGSNITEEDLSLYSVVTTAPVRMRLQNNETLYSVPTPGSGALLAFILGILNNYNITREVTRNRDSTSLTLHRITEAFKFAYARRMEMEDDAIGMKEFMKNLTSPDYAEEIWKQIVDDKTFPNPDHYGLHMAQGEDHGTAHLSIVAPNGDAVSVTSTINLYFGSLMMSPSTGIILNNEMDDFSSPNITNHFGVPPSTKNHIKAGKRPMSSMCPAIIVDGNGDVKLVVGGNGGTQITTGVALTILRTLWLEDDIKMAIDAPRFHHQLLPDQISHEKDFPQDLLDDLRKRGHDTDSIKGRLAIIMAIARGKDGRLYANSDYRKGGSVDGF